MNYEQIAVTSEVVSAILFVALLVWIWHKFITPGVLAAQQRANDRIATAEQHLAQAKAAAQAVQAEIASANEDAEGIKARAVSQGAAEAAVIEQEAREAGERAVRSAKGELDRARAAAREQYRDELLSQALDAARARARERVDANVNEKLIANFLDSLGHGGNN